MENSLNILSESLDEKYQLLMEIQKYNEKQAEAFGNEQMNLDAFDAAIEEKDALIERLLRLEEGFELLYQNISKDLKENQTKYASKIRQLQEKIQKVMDLSVAIQAQEARNKRLVEDYFRRERGNLRQSRLGAEAAFSYYRTMSQQQAPRFDTLDTKNRPKN